MDKLNVDDLFRCFNCDYMVEEPHESECCGKLYCQSCTVDLSYTQCKLCKKSIRLRPNIFAKKLLQKVELKCRHHCGGKFTYEEMKLHMYRCESRILKCTIEFCCFVGRKYELIPHMMENHEIYLMALLENYDDFQEAFDKILKNPIDKRPPKKDSSPFNYDMEYSYPGVLPRLRTIVNANPDNNNITNTNLLNRNSDNYNEYNYDFDELINEFNNYNSNERDRDNYYDYLNTDLNLVRRNRLRPINNSNYNNPSTLISHISYTGNINQNLENLNGNININNNTNPNTNNHIANNLEINSINNNDPNINVNNILNESQDNLITEINNNYSNNTLPIFRQAPLSSTNLVNSTNNHNMNNNTNANNDNNIFNTNTNWNPQNVDSLHTQLNNQIMNLHNNIEEITDNYDNPIGGNSPYDSFGVNYHIVDNRGNSHVYEMSFNAINDEEDHSENMQDIDDLDEHSYRSGISNDNNQRISDTNNYGENRSDWI